MNYYVVDVFTDKSFCGNPAGVCLLDKNIPDETMQNIAMENNLSETAFLLKQDGYYDLRWFTPQVEVDLCGHATMASAYILFRSLEKNTNVLKFHTLSGVLTVEQKGEMLWMNFPSRPAVQGSRYDSIGRAFGVEKYEVYKSADLLVVIDNEETIKSISPDFDILKVMFFSARLGLRCAIGG